MAKRVFKHLLFMFVVLLQVAKADLPIPTFIRNEPMWVESQDDWYVMTGLHKLRVTILAMRLMQRHPERYGRLDARLLLKRLELHDSPKTEVDLKKIAEWGFDRPIGRILYEDIYGGKLTDASPERKQQLLTIIRRMNEIEKKLVQKFYETFSVSTRDQELMDELEKIADIVDRNASPTTIEEFGTIAPFHVFLGSNKNPKIKRQIGFARELRREYADLIRGFDYATYRMANDRPTPSLVDIPSRCATSLFKLGGPKARELIEQIARHRSTN